MLNRGYYHTPETREENGVYLTSQMIDISLWKIDNQPLGDVLTDLEIAGSKLLNPVLHIETHKGYYDEIDIDIWLTGDRHATPQEINSFRKKQERDLQRKEARKKKDRKQKAEQKIKDDEAALKRARKVFPEMFKD